MCTWQRIDRLPLTLSMLESQTYGDFTFYIWNNNISYSNRIADYMKDSPLDTRGFLNNNNIGGIGRFVASRGITHKHDYVIFIDDDQLFEPTFIQQMVSYAKPNTIAGWYAWEIRGGYFDRTPATNKADYVGTGGMICDINAFKNKTLFNIPSKYQFVEDLWLSFYCKYELGYELYKASVNMTFMPEEDKRDQFRVRNLGPLKAEFYHYLNVRFKEKVRTLT